MQGHVDQWVAAALELGRLDERRAQLETERTTGPEASPGLAYAARLSWIRVMRSVINLFEVDPQATPEIKERLLARCTGPRPRSTAAAAAVTSRTATAALSRSRTMSRRSRTCRAR